MSIVERRSARPSRGSAGYTYLELMVTIVILSLLSLITERTVSTLRDSERYLGALRLATERGQGLAYQVRDIAASSRKLYGNDTDGQAYLASLELGTRPLAPGARLPLIDEVNPLGPDEVGTPLTGNVLLLVRESDPAPCMANPVTKKQLLVDVYRFVCVYPTVHARTVVNGQGPAHDLVIWRSRAFPSHAQLLAIPDAGERTAVVADLVSRFGYDQAWDTLAGVDAAFFNMDSAGTLSGTPEAVPVIEMDDELTEGGRLVYANLQLARTDTQAHVRRAVLSQDDLNLWEPHGFELKVVGPSAARKVWLHLVVEAQAGHGRSAMTESTLIASTSDI